MTATLRQRQILEIEAIIRRETAAWDTQDIDLLLSIFHPDMVWVWPKNAAAHDPLEWESVLGRFDDFRWRQSYAEMFAAFALQHNRRSILKIEVTAEGDGAFAVVDIDTLWQNRATGENMHWLGRTCKTYVCTPAGWKMIAQTGALQY